LLQPRFGDQKVIEAVARRSGRFRAEIDRRGLEAEEHRFVGPHLHHRPARPVYLQRVKNKPKAAILDPGMDGAKAPYELVASPRPRCNKNTSLFDWRSGVVLLHDSTDALLKATQPWQR
jgi:hypothetical protein